MRLTENQREILYSMRLDADIQLVKLARALGMRHHTVRYALKRLEEGGVVSRFAYINLASLGYTEYDVISNLSLYGDERRAQFFDELKSASNVIEIFETAGSKHCAFTICAHSPGEVDRYLKELTQKVGDVLVTPQICARIGDSTYPPKYLTKRKPPYPEMSMSGEAVRGTPPVDSLDQKILGTLARHVGLPHRRLAQRLAIPLSTLEYRLANLRKRNIYLGNLFVIRPQAFGYQQFLALVSLRGLTQKLDQQVARFGLNHRDVTYLVRWLGPYQYALALTCRDADEAGVVANSLHDLLGSSLTGLELLPIIRAHKFEYFPLPSH